MADIKSAEAGTKLAHVPSHEQKHQLTEHEIELEAALAAYVPDSPAEKKLVRKMDMVLMPTLWFMYIMAYIDRQNIGNAKIAGMDVDLSLTDDEYAMLLSIFFIGYLIFEVPSNLVLTRAKPSWYLPGIMVGWGTICALMSLARNYETMLALRFLLGAIEAGLFPGVLFLMSCWYKKSEIGKRFSIFYTASVFSGALSGLLAGVITDNMEGLRGMRGWRWLFLVEGVAAVFFACFFKFILLDFPENTRRFSLEERQLAVVRMIADRKMTATRHGAKLNHWQAVKAALADPRTFIFMLLLILNLGSMTISYFIPGIVRSMGYTSVHAQYMTMPIWLVAAVFLVVLSYTADRFQDRRWHVCGCMGLSFLCTILCIAISNDKVLYAMLCFYIAGLYTGLPLILTWTSETISLPAEKRAVVVALVNSVGNLSAVYGSRLWPSSDGPKFTMGFATVGAFTGFGCILAALIPVILRYLPSEGRTKAEREILARERELDGGARVPRDGA